VENLVYFAFAGLFSMTLLSLTFSFLLGIKLKNLKVQIKNVEEQMSVAKKADDLIIDEITQVVNMVDKKLNPILDFVVESQK
jgi:hypothetical protein